MASDRGSEGRRNDGAAECRGAVGGGGGGGAAECECVKGKERQNDG
jgi:hypothetical protein